MESIVPMDSVGCARRSRVMWRSRGTISSPGKHTSGVYGAEVADVHASAQFLEARDQLLGAREDWPPARREFRWPALTHFNWARDYFDIVASASQAPALRVVDDAGGDQTYSFAQLS